MIKNRCLIIFVKYPEKGKVKSRLAKHLTDNLAVGLYENFVLDIIGAMENGSFRVKIYFYPEGKEKEIKVSFGEKYEYAAQKGTDLGERMKNAFLREFTAGFEQVVLIGSDCPDLPADIIEEAFRFLENQSNVVIGPSMDGGYYLIGFQKDAFCPDIFSGPQWGNSSVLEKTMNILHSQDKQFSILPAWRDIDTHEDLTGLIKKSADTPFARSKTMKFIRDNISIKR
ncbi:MAG: TIGR04282 family arsenosugar biosynthesis glycosyltransferase [Smithella sp.]|jgi:rSAM/selenodomain-associated transferase 1